jgi:hypothetical protein
VTTIRFLSIINLEVQAYKILFSTVLVVWVAGAPAAAPPVAKPTVTSESLDLEARQGISSTISEVSQLR